MSEPPTQQGDGATEIRKILKRKRRNLPQSDAVEHAEGVALHLVAVPEVTNARTVGAYLALGGELDPEPTLALLTAARYVPLVDDDFSMEFKLVTAGTPMVQNRYGIDEPAASAQGIDARDLDVVLVPLVAFDKTGTRIGMGGGYYDRHFAFRKDHTAPPTLIGVAHAFQEVESIDPQPWDVRLDMVVTENGLIHCG